MIAFDVDNLTGMSSRLKLFAESLKELDVCDDDVFFIRLVSAELISNVIKHGNGRAYFRCELHEDKISVFVRAELPENFDLNPAAPDVFSESGRGLYIINAVSDGLKFINGEFTASISRKK